MTQPSSERTEPSPNAERLRVAMGWERLPEMTSAERQAFEAEEQQVDEQIRRYYGIDAA
jgi:hypothetical protein